MLINGKSDSLSHRDYFIKFLVYSSIFLLSLDLIYQTYSGITYQTREKCILYTSLPRWMFLLYENLIELVLIVLVGVFIAALLEKYFTRWHRFVPKNQSAAFLYASLMPVCSCGVIPLIGTMENRIPFRTTITFIVAAPLLNPYIIMVSFTVLGVKYAVLRIICSFILAVSAGYIVDYFYRRQKTREILTVAGCKLAGCCPRDKKDIYRSTYVIFRNIMPFILLAGLLSMALELLAPGDLFRGLDFENNLIGTTLVILVGVPVYFCNGADVLFLKPFINHGNLPMGTAISFSLTSTSVCISSLVMLIKFIGKKLTFILLTGVILITLSLSFLIQMFQL